MTTDHENAQHVIADAGMGWKPPLQAKTFWLGKPCRACRSFAMRMIKSSESDSFGHLLPYCNHPMLPGAGGCRTQMLSSCDHWSAK